ncbi:MAG: transrane sensor histidine kinase transcriptional regulator [Gammaproteobacteria bacterium]|nr:transrane sensor histidine kinase transcriptional regulator [Gammaproteobacteria bacterium]
MSAGENQTDLNEIDLEALRWLAVMERGALAQEEQRRFAAWVAADIKHQGAIIRAQAASVRLDRLAALAGGRSVVESLPQKEPLLQGSTTRRRIMVAAASAAGLIGIGSWLGRGWIEENWGGTWYSSSVGELKKVVLTDGSVLTLNTQTALRVRYTRDRRDIRLVRGEVMFTVAHDAKRPFAVRVRDWAAVAVGTAFVVRQLDEPTADVTVTEGIVQLLPVDRSVSEAPLRLTANQKALIGAGGRVEVGQLSDSQIGQRLAWRTRLVVFAGEPLREALAEMNRYGDRRIVVDDPELGERRIAGVFSTTDTQTFVSAMTATLGVEAVGSGKVVLLRRVN